MTEASEPVDVEIEKIIIDKTVDKTTIMLMEEGRLVIRTPEEIPVLRLPLADDAAASAKKELTVGEQMTDGSVYAGATADGKYQIFAMPEDLDVTMTFNNAAKAVNKLNSQKALGHDDWQIPSLDNLKVLQKNQNEGALKGTFKTAASSGSDYPDWYWSSTEVPTIAAWVHGVRFTDGLVLFDSKDNRRLSCRPVRLVPVL